MGFKKLFREIMGPLTQPEFGALLGIDQSHVCNLLCGRRNPGWKTVSGLIKAFPKRRVEILTTFGSREVEA